MQNIHPVILCGGSGTRLWPLSRKSYPKQFVKFSGDESLLQAVVRRLQGSDVMAPLVVTNSDFRFILSEQLIEAGVDPGAILIEPSARNTAPAILAAALFLAEKDPEALLLVMPSDQVIPDSEAFREAVDAGLGEAVAGRIVTFGIRPTRPETGYGWLELSRQPGSDRPAPVALQRFIEKPEAGRAAQMLADGRYLWNAGIFLLSVKTALAAYEAYAPTMINLVKQAVTEATADLGFLRLAPEPWSRVEEVSVDYAIMERADNLQVVPFAGHWTDLGDWASLLRESDPNEHGIATYGPVTAIDCCNSLLRAESDGLELVAIGLKDLLVIAMPDAVLVADRNRAQDVKLAVNALKTRDARQAEHAPRDHRPWGWFETLALGGRFQVKRIVVHPGASLSLQSHFHRSEHWIVVSGTARVMVDQEVKLLAENQSIYIPLGSRHRLENPGKVPMVLIEVQTGAYLGEDDIVRHEDVYARGQGAKG